MLSDTEIRKTKPQAKQFRMTDGHGLYLNVTAAGGKLWRWKYRFQGTEKLMSFGSYPDVSLLDARERHAAGRKLLAAGVDPMEQRKVERAAAVTAQDNSFKSVAGQWLEHWKIGKDANHVVVMERRLKANIFPSIGSRPIADIEAPDLVVMVKAIEARGVGTLARLALGATGQIFRYAVAHGHAKRNPAADIRPGDVLKPTVKTNMARVEAQELPKLLRSIELYNGNVLTRLAMKLMALTFVRTSELIGARWSEFDVAARRWNIPAERMKMKSPHIVPLATQAIEQLELLRSITGEGELLFPNNIYPNKHMSKSTILAALYRMGYAGEMTGHGFRGVASTLLHEQGFAHDHIELQLAHMPRNAVSAAYNHALYLEPRAKMMQQWADYLQQAQQRQ